MQRLQEALKKKFNHVKILLAPPLWPAHWTINCVYGRDQNVNILTNEILQRIEQGLGKPQKKFFLLMAVPLRSTPPLDLWKLDRKLPWNYKKEKCSVNSVST